MVDCTYSANQPSPSASNNIFCATGIVCPFPPRIFGLCPSRFIVALCLAAVTGFVEGRSSATRFNAFNASGLPDDRKLFLELEMFFLISGVYTKGRFAMRHFAEQDLLQKRFLRFFVVKNINVLHCSQGFGSRNNLGRGCDFTGFNPSFGCEDGVVGCCSEGFPPDFDLYGFIYFGFGRSYDVVFTLDIQNAIVFFNVFDISVTRRGFYSCPCREALVPHHHVNWEVLGFDA